ncbi:hypothetical protein PRZ48_009435 [Zasmidium cellare]|uniref:Amino acid permease/ SLC12A domain-containing protein n=1 Tax=Zasmidium cellare TaxID=395010 RepID=A0ABR0ECC7_ZASCE|nr:hypothetical protein PRZ48_009435 [Zasmidium cellare]
MGVQDIEATISKAPQVHSDSEPDVGEVVKSDEITRKYGTTKRGLSGRHVQLMAIAGAIGTGLFVGIGNSLSKAGPLSVLLAYIIYPTLFIWPCNMCVAEMATHLPIRGSIYEFASRYVDPAFGFALGWTYFFASSMLYCAEISAVATIMEYWNIDVNPAVWVALVIVVCVFLNVFAVKWYGESEFIFGCTKLLLIIGLCLLTFITMLGGNPRNDRYGFRHWTGGNAMHEYYTTGTTGRFLGFWSVITYAAFSVAGPDMIALATGEIRNPRRNIPRVARMVFFRIIGFYVMGVLGVGIICSSRDSRLLGAIEDGAAGSAASPWVIGITNLGINGLASLVNVLILLSGWSCGNAYLYSASRTLYSLALDGQAPKLFMKCTAAGNPIYAVMTVSLIGCITFLVASNSAVTVFDWFVSLCTCGFVISYMFMICTWIGWNRGLKAQGISRDTLHWKAPLMPYAAYVGVGMGCVVLLFLGFDTFVPWDVKGFVTSYFGLAFAAFVYIFWKVFKRTKPVKPADMDFWTGKEEVDAECSIWEVDDIDKPTTLMGRIWDKMW